MKTYLDGTQIAEPGDRVVSQGGVWVQTTDEAGPFQIWVTASDSRVCDKCEPLNGLVFETGEGIAPPYHPGCRCVRLYIDMQAMSSFDLVRLALSEAVGHGKAGT